MGFSNILWEALEERTSFEKDWLRQWEETVGAAREALTRALKADELVLSRRATANWTAESAPTWHQL